jgi:hypothetical protein
MFWATPLMGQLRTQVPSSTSYRARISATMTTGSLLQNNAFTTNIGYRLPLVLPWDVSLPLGLAIRPTTTTS